MSTKEKLLERLHHIEDEHLLASILEMIELEMSLSAEPIILSSEQQSFVERGLDDVTNGRTVSDKEAKELVREWLKNR